MDFFISTNSGLPIYLQIVNQVKGSVAGGLLNPGEKLPSVRDLAITLAINPNTVSKAYSTLEIEGIIEIRKGMGTFISEGSELNDKDKKEKILPKVKELIVEAYHLQIDNNTLLEIINQCLKIEGDNHDS
ncbi:GntR family transcriptional regulator [Alkalicella caledoniensis]|uniref:GntR family transcriptional regulator n=1 Tax=Alkalicella caledoniensis TaxID=2731377 RepID=A0A7G9W833_ALKCA|nr:GntR family transcriptional regulator [Alkalicella caledoniensis]QNO14845.1 GntR family transcriptional regulator [Alkalicella caledoniensis]